VPVVLEIPPIIFLEDSSYSFDLDTLVIDVDHDTTEISWFASFPTNIITNIHQQLNKKKVQKSRQIPEVNREESKNINDERENQTEIKTGKILKQRGGLKIKPPIKNFQSEAITESKEEQTEQKVIRRKQKDFSDHMQEPLRDAHISVYFPESMSSPGISVLGITQGDNDSLIIAIDSLTHIATITATLNFYSLDIPVIFTAIDDSGASDSDTTVISVNPVNDPPIISQLPDTSFFEDDTLIYPISNWFPYVYDPDTPDGHLSYILVSGNNVMANPGNAVYFLNAPENWFGRDTLQLIVSDSVLADTAALYVNVESVNDPPTITGAPDSLSFVSDSSASLDIWEYVEDVETLDSLLDYQFDVSEDSIFWSFDTLNGELTISSTISFGGIASLYITVTDDSFATAMDSLRIVVSQITGIDDDWRYQIPKEYVLLQNYPNPFNPVTHIRFGLPKASDVILEIYNVLGQRLITLVDTHKPAGYHEVILDATQLASGIYLYKIQSGEFNRVKKMILMK